MPGSRADIRRGGNSYGGKTTEDMQMSCSTALEYLKKKLSLADLEVLKAESELSGPKAAKLPSSKLQKIEKRLSTQSLKQSKLVAEIANLNLQIEREGSLAKFYMDRGRQKLDPDIHTLLMGLAKVDHDFFCKNQNRK